MSGPDSDDFDTRLFEQAIQARDERASIDELLLAVEMVLREIPVGYDLEEVKRVLKLVRDYRSKQL